MDIMILLITLISSIFVGHFQYKISKDGSFKQIFTILYAIMLLVIVNINIHIFYLFVIVSFIIEIIYKVYSNKLKLRKRLITFVIMLCSLIVIYIVSHITPHNAVRAHLFITGHPIVAFTTRVSEANISDQYFKHKLEIFHMVFDLSLNRQITHAFQELFQKSCQRLHLPSKEKNLFLLLKWNVVC